MKLRACLVATLSLVAATAVAEPAVAYPEAGLSSGGAQGFGRLTSALPGAPGVVRAGLRGGLFASGGFPDEGASNRLFTGELSASWTALPVLEVFGAYRSTSNANSLSTPKLVQAQGDFVLGAKAGRVFSGFELGADLRFDVRNGVGSDLPALDGSTAQLRALGGHTLTVGGRPLSLNVNLGAALGRSETALDDRLTPALLFGTGFSAYHRLLFAAGARYDLGRVSPFVAFDLDQPLGIDDAELQAADVGSFGAAAKRIVLGARVKTTAWSALDLAAEVGFGSGVRGFAPTQPWMLTAGWSFAFDSKLYAPPPPPVAPTTGLVAGTVLDQAGEPVAGVLVSTDAQPPVATDALGRFITRALAAGPVTLSLSREGYASSTVELSLVAGATSTVEAQLEKLPEPPPPPPPPAPPPPPPPPAPRGYVAGLLTVNGAPVKASVALEGAEKVDLVTEDGRFSAQLLPGEHRVTVLPEGGLAWTGAVSVTADQATALVVPLLAAPTTPGFTETEGKLVPVRAIALDEKSAADQKSAALLQELVDWLVRHPTRRLDIHVHADPGKDDRKAWSEARAQSLLETLLTLGAPAERVKATGYGVEQPIVPLTSRQKARNRRVELVTSEVPAPVVAPLPKVEEAPAVVEGPATDETPEVVEAPAVEDAPVVIEAPVLDELPLVELPLPEEL